MMAGRGRGRGRGIYPALEEAVVVSCCFITFAISGSCTRYVHIFWLGRGKLTEIARLILRIFFERHNSYLLHISWGFMLESGVMLSFSIFILYTGEVLKGDLSWRV